VTSGQQADGKWSFEVILYRWDREKHDDELLLAQHGMAHEGVGKAGKATATFFNKRSIGS